MDGHAGKGLLERMQEFNGIPVAIDDPKHGQLPPYFLQGCLHDIAIGGGAGLGSGGGVDDHGMRRVVLYRVEQLGPTVRVVQGVHYARQVGKIEIFVRLVHVRIIGVRIHKQDIAFLV